VRLVREPHRVLGTLELAAVPSRPSLGTVASALLDVTESAALVALAFVRLLFHRRSLLDHKLEHDELIVFSPWH